MIFVPMSVCEKKIVFVMADAGVNEMWSANYFCSITGRNSRMDAADEEKGIKKKDEEERKVYG